MRIKSIGNYTIVNHKFCKQVYSQTRMLQVGKNKTYYIDLINSKLIKVYKRVNKWLLSEVE